MKCTSDQNRKIRLLCLLLCIAALFTAACGNSFSISNAYPVYTTDLYISNHAESGSTAFSQDLCVTGNLNFGTEKVDSQTAEGAGVFNITTGEVCYSQNMFTRMYPASTTKILTAYIILKNYKPADEVTVSDYAADQDPEASVCGLRSGDVISVEDLLYGLLLVSGNDAAIALAEYYSGSVEAFAEVMNREALALGASNSHFVNPNGLPDEEHYTTVYDMYLIFQAALKSEEFVNIIGTESYDASYTNANGGAVQKNWKTTNWYLLGNAEVPEGFTVVGGKTGTTSAAGNCLVLYSRNENEEKIISIVFKADSKSNVYRLTSQILSGFAK